MKIKILILAFFLSFTKIYAQVYSVGNGDGFSFENYTHNTNLAIYSVGNGDGFSFNGCEHNVNLAIYSVGSGDGYSHSNIGGMGTEVPLPTELIMFKASCYQQKVSTIWATASQINNDYFTIERSAKGVDFQNIGTVAGAGNSNQTLYYIFDDSEPLEGISYYRLKQTDFDGQFEYSNVIAVENCKETSMTLSIYPNPSNGKFFILYSGGEEDVSSIKVYNVIGEMVYRSDQYQSIIDISDQKSGIYFVQLVSQKGIIIEKIIFN